LVTWWAALAAAALPGTEGRNASARMPLTVEICREMQQKLK